MKEAAMAKMDMKPSGKMKLRELRVKPSENGGVTVIHEMEHSGGMYMEPKSYIFSGKEGDKALAHIAEHAGIPGAKEEVGEPEHMEAKSNPKAVTAKGERKMK